MKHHKIPLGGIGISIFYVDNDFDTNIEDIK